MRLPLLFILHYVCSIKLQPRGLLPSFQIDFYPRPENRVVIESDLTTGKKCVRIRYDDTDRYIDLLSGLVGSAHIQNTAEGGAFISFENVDSSSQFDVSLGQLPDNCRFLALSRIKRWWMAPSFGVTADDVPVETQQLLLETSGMTTMSSSNSRPDKSQVFPTKLYTVIIPLIDFDKGFRATLFGKDGGTPAGRGNLAVRLESGDPAVRANAVSNALYIASGRDPYEVLEAAYAAIALKLQTFRLRVEKQLPPGLDDFGFCTWDAFYSRVDTGKVKGAIESLARVGFSPKFVIIDDGWQSTAPAKEYRTQEQAAGDGDLSGAQIDGAVALGSAGKQSPILKFLGSEVLRFYSEKVEKGKPDSLSVKLWAKVSHTILKTKLLDFFALQTDFSKRLTSWRANAKFEDPEGGSSLKEFVSSLKESMGIKHVFVWHALSGYWGGVSDEASDELPRELAKGNTSHAEVRVTYSKPTPHLLLVEPALAWDPGSLSGVGAVALTQLGALYEKMHRYLADAGIDGVKVDAQSGIGAFGAGNGGGPQFARSVVRAAEDSVRAAFSQSKVPAANSIFSRLGLSRPQVSTTKKFGLEGCMCHSSENFLNFYETSTVRASDDFYPKDRAAQTVHIASCAYNSVLLSEIALPDWDMFHSKHEFALVHAAARAISGGPIYVSDNIGNHDPTVLARLVLPNGDVLRTSLPARPTVDCLFSDVMRDRKTALKVFSVNKVGGGVVGVFNVQGAGWDRAKRKYYQHDASPPVVFTEVSARSCGSTFLRSGGKSATGVFVAWLVLAQELKLLESELVSIPVQVGVRACEVVTIAHVYRVQPITYFGYKLAAVEWAPLGLIDMLNPGGAVVQLLTSRKYNEAKLTIRGVGRFGIYCSRMPITVTVNGKRVPFEYSQDSLLVIEISGPVTNRQISLTW